MRDRRRSDFIAAVEQGSRRGKSRRATELLSLAALLRAARPPDREPSELGSMRISNRVFRANRRKATPPAGSGARRLLNRGFALAALFLLMAVSLAGAFLAGASRETAPETAREAVGEVSICGGLLERGRGGEWEAIGEGALLHSGDGLRTSGDGRAEIHLADGSMFRMDGSTEMSVDSCSAQVVELTQLAGGSYHRAANASSYSLKTSSMQVTGAGAAFSVAQSAERHDVEVMSLYAGLQVAAESESRLVSGNLGEGQKCLLTAQPGVEVELRVEQIAKRDLEQEWLRWNRDRDLAQDRQLGVLAEMPLAPIPADEPSEPAQEEGGAAVKSIILSAVWQPPAMALDWTVTGYEDFDSLRIFRSRTEAEAVTFELSDATSYLDASCVEGAEYSYQLAIYRDGVLVATSEPLRVLAGEVPVAPRLRLSAVLSGSHVELSGELTGAVPFTGYALLRSSTRTSPSLPLEAGESSFNFAGGAEPMFYLDKSLQAGKTYYYRLLLINDGVVVLRSNTIEVVCPAAP